MQSPAQETLWLLSAASWKAVRGQGPSCICPAVWMLPGGIHNCLPSEKTLARWAFNPSQRGCYMFIFLSSFWCCLCLTELSKLFASWLVNSGCMSSGFTASTGWNKMKYINCSSDLFFPTLWASLFHEKCEWRLLPARCYLLVSSSVFKWWAPLQMGLYHCCCLNCLWCWCLKEHCSLKTVLLLCILGSFSPMYPCLHRF